MLCALAEIFWHVPQDLQTPSMASWFVIYRPYVSFSHLLSLRSCREVAIPSVPMLK